MAPRAADLCRRPGLAAATSAAGGGSLRSTRRRYRSGGVQLAAATATAILQKLRLAARGGVSPEGVG